MRKNIQASIGGGGVAPGFLVLECHTHHAYYDKDIEDTVLIVN